MKYQHTARRHECQLTTSGRPPAAETESAETESAETESAETDPAAEPIDGLSNPYLG